LDHSTSKKNAHVYAFDDCRRDIKVTKQELLTDKDPRFELTIRRGSASFGILGERDYVYRLAMRSSFAASAAGSAKIAQFTQSPVHECFYDMYVSLFDNARQSWPSNETAKKKHDSVAKRCCPSSVCLDDDSFAVNAEKEVSVSCSRPVPHSST
jgi:hypothetical protein